jgi:hypothetical protein
MAEVAVVLGLTLLGVLGWIALERAGYHAMRRRFIGRTEIPDQEFYDRYYAGTGIPARVVRDCRRRIGMASGVCWRLILPEDRFDGVLAPPFGMEFDSDLAALLADTGDRLSSLEDGHHLLLPMSVDEYIRAVARLELAQGSA